MGLQLVYFTIRSHFVLFDAITILQRRVFVCAVRSCKNANNNTKVKDCESFCVSSHQSVSKVSVLKNIDFGLKQNMATDFIILTRVTSHRFPFRLFYGLQARARRLWFWCVQSMCACTARAMFALTSNRFVFCDFLTILPAKRVCSRLRAGVDWERSERARPGKKFFKHLV